MCSIIVFTLPQTGIRDPDLTDNIEKSFLGPLRSTLIRWLEDPTIAAGTTYFSYLFVLLIGLTSAWHRPAPESLACATSNQC